MIEIVLSLYILVFIFMACMIIIYYYRIREEYKKYVSAKEVLNDIIVSFNSDLNSIKEKIELIKKENESSINRILNTQSEIPLQILNSNNRLNQLTEAIFTLTNDFNNIKKKLEDFISKKTLFRSKNELLSLSIPEEKIRTTTGVPISIPKEKALSPLTITELTILKLILNVGEMTAPAIRNEINLTREHTARLMKNLYARGYVERRTEKLPYTYRLKQEMINILSS